MENPRSTTVYDEGAQRRDPEALTIAGRDVPDTPEVRHAIAAAKTLFASRQKPFISDPDAPTEQELHAIGAALRRAGVKGVNGFKWALMWIAESERRARGGQESSGE